MVLQVRVAVQDGRVERQVNLQSVVDQKVGVSQSVAEQIVVFGCEV